MKKNNKIILGYKIPSFLLLYSQRIKASKNSFTSESIAFRLLFMLFSVLIISDTIANYVRMNIQKSQFPKFIFGVLLLLVIATPSYSQGSCNCTEYIYLNEPTTNGAIHKYSISSGDGSLTEIGSPWYDNAVAGDFVTQPHGLIIDLNGFIYVGENTGSASDIRKLDCDGNIFPESDFAILTGGLFNMVSIGNKVFGNNGDAGSGAIVQYDLCTGNEVNRAFLCNIGQDWGLYYDANTEIFYATGGWTGTPSFHIFTYDDFGNDAGTCVPLFDLEEFDRSVDMAPYGVTTDEDGFLYVVIRADASLGYAAHIDKYSPAPDYNFITRTVFSLTNPAVGLNRSAGIVYSKTSGKLYVSTESPVGDCISIFNTDLTYSATGVLAPPNGNDNGKGIAIISECCPSPLTQTIDQTLCGVTMGEKLFLNEIFPCDGTICGAAWILAPGNTGMTYDDCDQSITITDAEACGTFTKQGSNAQCGAYNLTYNVETLSPVMIVVSADQMVCSGDTPTALSVTTSVTDIQWQISTTSCIAGFTDIAGATAATYTPSALTNTTYYRAIVNATGTCSSGSCPFESECVTVTVDTDCVLPCTNPAATAFAIQPSCVNGSPISDGFLQVSATDGDRVNFSAGSTYTGNTDYGNATPIGALPFQFGAGLPNPSGSQDYTVRVFNGASACFTDVVVTMNEQDCTVGCDCNEYIYLNEPAIGAVLKFEVDPSNLLLTQISAADGTFPWYPGAAGTSELPSPHGAAFDLNGNLYIGSDFAVNTPIRKFDCDGVITPIDGTTINNDFIMTNMFSIGNTLYTTRGGGPASYDLCSGELLGTMCLNDDLGAPVPHVNTANFSFWGLSYNETTDMVYATGQTDIRQRIYAFTRAELEAGIMGGACIDPLVTKDPASTYATLAVGDTFLPSDIRNLSGVVGDNAGNMYVTGYMQNSSGILIKYNSAGVVLATATLDPSFRFTRGVVWSELTNQIYVANQIDNATVDCISAFDATSLAYLGTAAPNPDLPTNNSGKALSLVRECCPTSNNQTIDLVQCITASSDPVFLNEIFPCDGTICEAQWTPVDAFSAGVFETCDQSINSGIAAGCYSFERSSDGASSNSQCGAFYQRLNLEIIEVPDVEITSFTSPVCSGNQATLMATTTSPNIKWQSSTTSCNDDFSDILNATSNTLTTAALTETTYFRAVVSGTNAGTGGCQGGNCDFESECVTVVVNLLPTITQMIQSVCNDNGTRTDPSDDYFTIDINATGTINSSAQYQVVIGTNADGTGGTVLATSNYGTAATVGTVTNFVADGTTTYVITIRDANTCFQNFTTTIVESCSNTRIDYPDYENPDRECANSPCHEISTDIYLGSSVDGETSASGSTNADSDVDDGPMISPNMRFTLGNTVRFPVIVYNNTGNVAHLRMWIDWNGDGDFEDVGEQVEDTLRPSLGAEEIYLVEVTIPTSIVQNQSIAIRTRLSTDDTNSNAPCGAGVCAIDGEIEDYLIQVECVAPICVPVTTTIKSD